MSNVSARKRNLPSIPTPASPPPSNHSWPIPISPTSTVSPEIDTSTMLRAATGAGEKGRLPCRVLGAPQPIIAWTRSGQPLNVNQSTKYSAEYRQIDALTYESVLVIERVAPADYGKYECAATNELGTTRELINLEITSPPEAPSNMTLLNVTHDSATVSWVPGFDGGMKAHFRVRYREANSEHYRYEDGLPNINQLTVTGLRTNTLYLFSIMAINGLGNSTYIPDLTKAQTKGKQRVLYSGPFLLLSLLLLSTSLKLIWEKFSLRMNKFRIEYINSGRTYPDDDKEGAGWRLSECKERMQIIGGEVSVFRSPH